MNAPASTAASGPGPSPARVRRRLAALLYETLLLSAVTFCAGLMFSVVFQQRDAFTHRGALDAWIVAVMAVYFVWPWTHGGQTLAMKTWRLRLETARGAPLGTGRALARFACAWLWWLPPLALRLAGLGLRATLVCAAVWAVCWAASAWLDPQRRFPHDRLAGTRIVELS